MLTLMKYEILRKQKGIFMFLSILAFLELGILFGIYKGGQWAALSISFIFVLVAGGLVMVFVDTLRSYSKDLNEKQGYSLFLTPSSGYKIIGSKSLISLIELVSVTLIIFALMFLNFQFTKSLYYDSVNALMQQIILFTKATPFIPSIGQTLLVIFTSIFEWFTVIMIAILSMTLRKTILSNSKYGWLISFIFFILIYSAMELINTFVLSGFGFIGDISQLSTLAQPDPELIKTFVYKCFKIACVLYPIYIGILYYFSGMLLNKRVDL